MFYMSLFSITLMTSCSILPSSRVKCNDEDSINTAIESFKNELDKKVNSDFKELVKKDDFKNIDSAKLRALVNSISYTLADTRTNHRDPDSDQVSCTAELTINIPNDIVKNSNRSREVSGQISAQEEAEKSNIKFEKSKIVYDLDYKVQPSDDRKKIFVALNNMEEEIVPFVANNILFALIKPIMENAKGKAASINQSQYSSAVAQDYAAEASAAAADAATAAADAANTATDAAATTADAAYETYSEYD